MDRPLLAEGSRPPAFSPPNMNERVREHTSPPDDRLARDLHAHACAAGADTYADPATGRTVFTALFLRRRGFCCGSGCRHCPYQAAIGDPESSAPAH